MSGYLLQKITTKLSYIIERKRTGAMVEIPANKHDEFTKALHGLVESGESFKTTNIYIKQYNNSRNNYRKMRAREHLEGNKKMNHKIISIITTYEKDGDFMGG